MNLPRELPQNVLLLALTETYHHDLDLIHSLQAEVNSDDRIRLGLAPVPLKDTFVNP